jgi:diguanylate cyclase (GGDEF)-like protein
MLKTVKVPKKFQAIFTSAEKTVSRFFGNGNIDVSKATIKISGERYLLVRASSLSIDFFKCVAHLYGDKEESESINTTRQLLFDTSHAIGMADAEHFQKTMNLVDPIDILAAGPVHFAYTGWASVELLPESNPTPDENYITIYNHPYSFEADAWLKAGEKSEVPVCTMSAGYSSGWCEHSFGIPLVATEIMCRAKGDKQCQFIMAHPTRIEGYIKDYLNRKPDIAKQATNYEIPGFFRLKMAEAALKESNKKLTESNQALLIKSNALEEKTHLIEVLSELGELLPTCITPEEIYTIFGEYASKLFPNYEGGLWVYTEDKTHLELISKWGDPAKFEDLIFSPQDCWALRQNHSYFVHASSPEPHCHHIKNTQEGYICIPITVGEETFGVLSIVFGFADLSHDEQSVAIRLGGDVAQALSNLTLRNTLHELSIRDYLTGLFNRRYMEEMLVKEIAKSKRNNSSLGIIMFDVDYFKYFNDTYGHDAGDLVLSTLGKFLRGIFRESDIICRFGGEEFLIILPDATQEHTLERAEALRQDIKKLHIKDKENLLEKVNISIGVAIFPQQGLTPRELLDAADEALYQAKAKGRDRVCLAKELTSS